jgi:hypothetical protein
MICRILVQRFTNQGWTCSWWLPLVLANAARLARTLFCESLYLASLLPATCLIAAAAAPDEKLVSGPQKGTNLPGPCEVFNINGTAYKGRFHCPVLEHGFDPGVIIFTSEKGADHAAVKNLVRRLDTFIEGDQESRLHAFMVILSPDFRSSATADGAKGREEIIKEAKTRDALLERLKDRAARMKSMILGCTAAEGPKTYKLNPKAEVTIVFYQQLKVIENYAYPPDKMTQDDADAIFTKIQTTLAEAKKRPAKK